MTPDEIFRVGLSGLLSWCSTYCPVELWVLFLLYITVSKSVGRRFPSTPGSIAIWHIFQCVGCLKSSTCTFWDILPVLVHAILKSSRLLFLYLCPGKAFFFYFTCCTFFPFWNGCFQLVWSPENIKPALSKHKTHCVLNIGCTPHSLAWYNFCLLRAPNRGLQKPNFWSPSTRNWILTSWRAAVSWILLQQCLKKPMATVLPTR